VTAIWCSKARLHLRSLDVCSFWGDSRVIGPPEYTAHVQWHDLTKRSASSMRQQGHVNLTQAYMAGSSSSLTSILARPTKHCGTSPYNIVGLQKSSLELVTTPAHALKRGVSVHRDCKMLTNIRNFLLSCLLAWQFAEGLINCFGRVMQVSRPIIMGLSLLQAAGLG
jgi:hypothetical protein